MHKFQLEKTSELLGSIIPILEEIKDLIQEGVREMEDELDVLRVSDEGCMFVGKRLVHSETCACGDYE